MRSSSLGLSGRRYGCCTVIEATTASLPACHLNTHRAQSPVCWPGSRLRPAFPHLKDIGTTHFNLASQIDMGARRAVVRGYTRRARRRCRSRPKNVRWRRWTDSWCHSNAPCPGSPSLSPSSPAFFRKTSPICSYSVPDTVCQAELEMPQCRRRSRSLVGRRGAVPLRTTLLRRTVSAQVRVQHRTPPFDNALMIPTGSIFEVLSTFWFFNPRFGMGSS